MGQNIHFDGNFDRVVTSRIIGKHMLVLFESPGFLEMQYSLKVYKPGFLGRVFGGWKHLGFWSDDYAKALSAFKNYKV